MLPRQPLRFLLADDPGAGKTIMAGLLIKELIAAATCSAACRLPRQPGRAVAGRALPRFHLPFEILTNDKLEAARTGNWFLETNLVIARLDKLSRNEDVQQKLQAPDCRWDLVVCDEAHKMSATFFGGEIKYTKRYRSAAALDPHAPLPADDGDAAQRQGRGLPALHGAARRRPLRGPLPRRRAHRDVSDLMRRMVKENLLKFDGTPLFPERIAYTVPYKLSTPRRALQGGHRLRARGVQPRRGAAERQARRARSASR
jgi:hypothetical protein